jgi:hypothetical protein
MSEVDPREAAKRAADVADRAVRLAFKPEDFGSPRSNEYWNWHYKKELDAYMGRYRASLRASF